MTSSGGARGSAGTYVRLCEIASGGMGSVDLAMRREGTFRRLFAIKRLLGHFREDQEVRAMFLDEARIAGLLRHPNAVSVVDVGDDEAGPFLVMEYVEGLSLGSMVTRIRQREQQIPVQVCARILAQCAHGLQAAHELCNHDGTWLKLVHRDVSPQNILVGFDGIVRLTDFGIAKAAGRATRTSTGLLKGKLSYMAPEQLRFEEPDRRSDLFALGVVAFETVSGKRLFKAESPRDAARKILNEDAPDVRTKREEVPEALATLLAELLSREPDRRPADAASVATRLEEIAATLAASEGPRDVASYMTATFQEAREESARRTADAMASIDSAHDLRIGSHSSSRIESEPAPTIAERAPRRARIGWALAVIAIGAAGALMWAAGAATNAPTEPRSTAPSVVLPPEPSPAAAAPPEPAPVAATDEPSVEPSVEPAAETAPEPRIAPRRARPEATPTSRRRTKRWDWE